jgi:hypothetical protein
VPVTTDYEPLPQALDIAEIRSTHAAHVLPGYADTPAVFRISGVSGHDGMLRAEIRADGSVGLCACHEPVVENGMLVGVRVARH